jgi:hypothetical protein
MGCTSKPHQFNLLVHGSGGSKFPEKKKRVWLNKMGMALDAERWQSRVLPGSLADLACLALEKGGQRSFLRKVIIFSDHPAWSHPQRKNP